MLLGDQTLGLGSSCNRIACVIAPDNLQRTAVNSACRVDLGYREVNTS